MDPRSFDVDFGTHRLHAWEWSRPDAPTAVVLHGIMGHGREWDVLTAELARTHRVVAVDQRGHGSSDWTGDYTVEALARDVVALVERLEAAPAVLVGHSMGGMAALAATAERPDLVTHLVVIDVGPESVADPEAAGGVLAALDHFATARYADVDEAVAVWAEGDALAREELLDHYARHNLVPADGGLAWRFDAVGLRQFVTEGVSAERLWAAVDAIEVPTLLVRGAHSPVFPRPAAEELATRLGRAQPVEIPDGAHDLGVQQPEAVAAAISAFLSAEAAGVRGRS